MRYVYIVGHGNRGLCFAKRSAALFPYVAKVVSGEPTGFKHLFDLLVIYIVHETIYSLA